MATDRNDKDNPNYTFAPPVQYTAQQVETGNKVVEIINSSLSDEEKSKSVYEILTNQSN
ncbi:hypothetical protein [Anabaena azotica]|uniref:Uncharacterized protein n=1 Tax=Anabaena azotica FACHB-119 TaxID=947527 RepID=A0ABR8DGV2_9NOST|nr:hypothetical protein [Anabaena azotica]MBD2505640.1 hypothetical protein [Anabaena azotica FACHB-119]